MSNDNCLHAFSDDTLSTHDGIALAKLIKTGEVSHKEVIEASINRANKVSSTLNAVTSRNFEMAIAQSSRPLLSGCFAGVPTFIKDNVTVQGLPTGHGSSTVKAHPSTNHDPYIKQYLAQGFTVLGKSNLPEFGFNATTESRNEPPTRNPWNLNYSSGASSGGSAALVASGVVPIAHANDGGGSIRIPAACCGLIGLKPSRGRHIETHAASGLPVNILSEGIVSRSVRDTAYFHAEAEKYYRNIKLPRIGLVTGPSKKRLRIAFFMKPMTGHPVDAETHLAIEESAELLSGMGHHVEEITNPYNQTLYEDFGLYWSFLAFNIQMFGKKIINPSFDKSKMEDFTLGLANNFRKNFYKTPLFMYRLMKSHQNYTKIFGDYDIMLSPVLAHTTPKLGHLSPTLPFDVLYERLAQYCGYTPLANVSGAPAISLPISSTSDNLPLSIHLASHHGDERTLLELAYEIEEAKPWRKIHTPYVT